MLKPLVFFLFSLSAALFSSKILQAEQLIFGVYANDNPRQIVEQLRPTLNELEKNLSIIAGRDITIKMDVSSSYHDAINQLVSGRVDFSRFGVASYLIAQQKNMNLRLLAIEKKKDQEFFYGIICVNAKSDIQTLGELTGRSFAFGDMSSTIGRYMAQSTLLQAGVYGKNLSHYDYLKRHDKVGMAVADGTYDAGAIKESTFKSLVKNGYALRSIKRMQVPTKPWIASDRLSQENFDLVQNALLAILSGQQSYYLPSNPVKHKVT